MLVDNELRRAPSQRAPTTPDCLALSSKAGLQAKARHIGSVPLLHIERELALYVGPLIQNSAHRHFAVQCSIALKGAIQLRVKEGLTEERSVVILPGVEHEVQCESALTMLLHPLSAIGRCLRNESIPESRIESIRESARKESLLDLKAQLNAMVCQTSHAGIDRRIEQTLLYLEKTPLLSAAEAAHNVKLSTGRFLHLFKEQTGLPYRRMILWNRLMIFFSHLQKNHDITNAALESGFADSAHLSRSVRQAFGMTAREIVKALPMANTYNTGNTQKGRE